MNKHSLRRGALAVLITIAAIFSLPLIALVAHAEAAAADAPPALNLSWTVPTARVAGEPLAINELAGYRISYTINGVEQPLVEIDDPAMTRTTIPLTLPPALEPYTVEGVIVAVDKWNMVSEPSNRVSDSKFVRPSSPPASPGGFTLTIECRDCTITMSAGQ